MSENERNSRLCGLDGLPLDKSCLEKELPDWPSASVAQMQQTWYLWEKYLRPDRPWGEQQDERWED